MKRDLLIFQYNKRRKILGKDFLYRKERGERKKEQKNPSIEVPRPKALKIIMTKDFLSLFRGKKCPHIPFIFPNPYDPCELMVT